MIDKLSGYLIVWMCKTVDISTACINPKLWCSNSRFYGINVCKLSTVFDRLVTWFDNTSLAYCQCFLACSESVWLCILPLYIYKRTVSVHLVYLLWDLYATNNAFLPMSDTWIYCSPMVLHQTSVVVVAFHKFYYCSNDLCICCCVMWFRLLIIFRWIWLLLQSLSGTREVRSDRQAGLWFFTTRQFQWIACLW